MTTQHYFPSPDDERALGEQLRRGASGLLSEQFDGDHDAYLDEVIPKPWGHEFRVYADDFYDVWKLCLRPGQGTSVHCHPRKLTALLCLGGTGRMQLLHERREVSTGDVAVIGRGVFHGTENVGSDDLHLVEVEVPRNKFDLVRLQDRYGRAQARYELEQSAAATSLRAGQFVHRSKLRGGEDLDGFRFGVRAGLDLASRDDDDLLFVISLSIAAALDQQVTVLSAAAAAGAVQHEELYLSIHRSNVKE